MWTPKQKRPNTTYLNQGFTIVELLVVIVVIGILAAITIVAYNGVQQRAHSVTAQTDAEAVSKLLSISSIANGTYPTTYQPSTMGNHHRQQMAQPINTTPPMATQPIA